jgi:hypothetical protein
MQHACDVLNRTTGPPGLNISSHEAVTGAKPRVMSILPFGCRAFAVKPRNLISKTQIDGRAFVGFNLGRSVDAPGAYYVWCPDQGRVVCTSDVYFEENLFPWRPAGDQLIGSSPAQPPPPDADAGSVLPAVEPTALPATTAVPPTMSAAYASAAARRVPASPLGRRSAARASRHILLLFSGPYNRADGLAAFLMRLGFEVTMVDNSAHGGDERHDILIDSFYADLLQRAHRGDFLAVLAAPPCSTFSISRFIHSDHSDDGGPPPVRTREHITGLPDVDPQHARELREANDVVDRTAAIIRAAYDSGAEYLLENPADYGRDDQFHFVDERHGPIWMYPAVSNLEEHTHGERVTFAQCAVGAQHRKLTTLLFSSGLAPMLRPFDRFRCTHSNHPGAAGGERINGTWKSAESAAYPAELNMLLAQAVTALVTSTTAPPPEAAAAPTPKPKEPAPLDAPAVDPATIYRNHGVEEEERLRAPPSPIKPLDLAADPIADGPSNGGASHDVDAEGEDHDATQSPAPPSPAKPPAGPRWKQGVQRGRDFNFRERPGRILLGRSTTFQVTPDFWKEKHGCVLHAKPPPSSLDDPLTRKEALQQDEAGWTAAEGEELENHRGNGSFTLLTRDEFERKAPRRKLIKMTWVYKRKRSGKLKARLCVQGCSQIPGVDYTQTWCGTLRGPSLRMLAALSTRFGMSMHRWDFTAAYLQGELDPGEAVYCHPPPGYETEGADGRQCVYRVDKPVYGLAQAGRRWQRTLFPWLSAWTAREGGPALTPSSYDGCVFHLHDTVDTPSGPRSERLFVGVYVDDLCICASHTDEYSLYARFAAALTERWKIEDEGEISDLLGIEVHREPGAITLHQRSYIDRMVERFLPDGIPGRVQKNSTPCSVDIAQYVSDAMANKHGAAPDDVRRFQSLVGSLLYAAMNTRPDIAYATGMLGRAMSCPTPELFDEAHRVLAYLHRTRDLGLRFSSSTASVAGMSDADWAVKHSTSGFVFTYCRAAISWASRKQKCVALSSCEAEIVAASDAAKEAAYLQRFLDELGGHDGKAISLSVDNKAAIDLSHNPEHHERTKHIDRRHFFVREMVEQGRLVVPFVRSADNLADFFTKSLPSAPFIRFRDIIMGHADG